MDRTFVYEGRGTANFLCGGYAVTLLVGNGVHLWGQDRIFCVRDGVCQCLSSGPQCEAGCDHVELAAYIRAEPERQAAQDEARYAAIECHDCRARQRYHDAWDRWDTAENPDQPEPQPPNLVDLRCISHEEFECRQCGNIIFLPDM